MRQPSLRFAVLLLAMTLVGACVATPAMRPPSEVPFLRQADGRIIVFALIDGAGPFPLIIDTGASVTVLDDSLVAELGLAARGVEVTVHGVGGASSAPAYEPISVALGADELSLPWVVGIDLPGSSDARGILGVDALAQRTIEIDSGARMLRLRSDRYAPPPGAGTSRSNMVIDTNGLPHVEIRVNNTRGLALIDTGLGGMIIDPAFAARAGVPLSADPVEFRDVTNEATAVQRTGRARLRIGQAFWIVERVALLRPEVLDRLDAGERTEAVLGASVFSETTLVLDFTSRRLYVLGDVGQLVSRRTL